MQSTAILSALAEEQHGLIDLLRQPRKTSHAGREFWQGELHGQPVVLALSKIGKVAAAITATALIERFGVSRMVFTGVAGGLGARVQVGDVVVATEFLQHDLDVSPLFPRYEVPFYGKARFESDPALTALLHAAATAALGAPEAGDAGRRFPQACVHSGLLASGDRFVSGAEEARALQATLSGAGHVVLAVLDNEFTVKTYWERAGRVRLKASNPTYPDIVPKDGQILKVFGVVVACFKIFPK